MSDYPARLLWVVGAEHAEALTGAAEYLHANSHFETPFRDRPDRRVTCDDCWRGAAYALKGALLAGYCKAVRAAAKED